MPPGYSLPYQMAGVGMHIIGPFLRAYGTLRVPWVAPSSSRPRLFAPSSGSLDVWSNNLSGMKPLISRRFLLERGHTDHNAFEPRDSAGTTQRQYSGGLSTLLMCPMQGLASANRHPGGHGAMYPFCMALRPVGNKDYDCT